MFLEVRDSAGNLVIVNSANISHVVRNGQTIYMACGKEICLGTMGNSDQATRLRNALIFDTESQSLIGEAKRQALNAAREKNNFERLPDGWTHRYSIREMRVFYVCGNTRTKSYEEMVQIRKHQRQAKLAASGKRKRSGKAEGAAAEQGSQAPAGPGNGDAASLEDAAGGAEGVPLCSERQKRARVGTDCNAGARAEKRRKESVYV